MHLPLFPLKLVFFPNQILPLHIFEPRYREMINYCIEKKSPFGIVLSKEDEEDENAIHSVGTAAKIVGVERIEDGRMLITALGTKRFQVKQLIHKHSYLSAEVSHFPVINGGTQKAMSLAQTVRPKIMEYVDAISAASKSKLPVQRLPQDPTSLAFLIAISLQVDYEEKQKLLSLPGIPEILNRENYLLWREVALVQHMIDTQSVVERMTGGPTGFVFPN